MKKQYLLLISLTLLVMASCSEDFITPNGNIISETWTVSEFNAIKSEISADIYVTQDPVQSLRIETNSDLLAVLETRVVNGELIIDSDYNIRGTTKAQVYISAADFSKISITGAGSLESMNCMNLNALELKISGSANINFCGTVGQFKSSISGSGDINAYGLNVNTADVTISGSGGMELTVSQSLKAKISGSGNIRYKGNPTVNSNITGSGKVVNVN